MKPEVAAESAEQASMARVSTIALLLLAAWCVTATPMSGVISQWRGGTLQWREVISEDHTKFAVEITLISSWGCSSCSLIAPMSLQAYPVDVETFEVDINAHFLHHRELLFTEFTQLVGPNRDLSQEHQKFSLFTYSTIMHFPKPGDGSRAAFGVRFTACCRQRSLNEVAGTRIGNNLENVLLTTAFALQENDRLGHSTRWWIPAVTHWNHGATVFDNTIQRFGAYQVGETSTGSTIDTVAMLESFEEASLEKDSDAVVHPTFTLDEPNFEIAVTWRPTRRGQLAGEEVVFEPTEGITVQYSLWRYTADGLPDSKVPFDFIMIAADMCTSCHNTDFCADSYTQIVVSEPSSSAQAAAFEFASGSFVAPATADEHAVAAFMLVQDGGQENIFMAGSGCAAAPQLPFDIMGCDPVAKGAMAPDDTTWADITFTFLADLPLPATTAIDNMNYIWITEPDAANGRIEYCAVQLIVDCVDPANDPTPLYGSCTSQVAENCIDDVGFEWTNTHATHDWRIYIVDSGKDGITVAPSETVSIVGLEHRTYSWIIEDVETGCHYTGSSTLQQPAPTSGVISPAGLQNPVVTDPVCADSGNIAVTVTIGDGWDDPVVSTLTPLEGPDVGMPIVVMDTPAVDITPTFPDLNGGKYSLSVLVTDTANSISHELVYEEIDMTQVRFGPLNYTFKGEYAAMFYSTEDFPGANSASIKVIIEGGTPPYTLTWTEDLIDRETEFVDTNTSPTTHKYSATGIDLSSSTQTLSLRLVDNLGCTVDSTSYWIVDEMPPFDVDVMANPVISPTCQGQSDGAVIFDVTEFWFHGLLTEWYEPCSEQPPKCQVCTPVAIGDNTCSDGKRYDGPIERLGCIGRRDLRAGQYRVVFRSANGKYLANPPAALVTVPEGPDLGLDGNCHPRISSDSTCVAGM